MGELACIGAALIWALAVSMFRDPIRRYGARTINLLKCSIAAALLGATVFAVGQGQALAAASGRDVGLILLSGVVGLSIGDTALFGAVGRIGPHRTLLLQTLVPVWTALIAAVWPGELPSAQQALGAALTLAGVVLVVADRRADFNAASGGAGPAWRAGVALALMSAFFQAVGIVMAKAGMQEIPVLTSSFVRIFGAAAGMIVLVVAGGRLGRSVEAMREPRSRNRILAASFVGTYVAFMLMMAGLAWSPAAIAAVLLSTSPVFSLFIDAAMHRQPVRARAVVGTIVAVAGVAWITFS